MKNILKILLMTLILLLSSVACGKPSEEEIRTQMKKYLYEKYGEEFVVENIGLRSANDQKFYQAKIYPKSIIGTPKENDDYYYASASIDVSTFGRLSKETGDSYSFIYRNDDVENYLLPKAKELFGDKIRIKVEVDHQKTGDGSWWAGYKSSSLKEMREDIKKKPKTNRMVLEIYLYIFDRIDNEKEKEERRQQIFDFIQYLKKEGLFEYLRLSINIVDERVLTNSYRELREEQNIVMEDTYVEKYNAYMKIAPLSFKEKITNTLTNEIKQMKQEDINKNMNKILKTELGGADWEGFIGDSVQYISLINSKGRLEMDNDYQNLSIEEKNRINYINTNDVLIEDLFHKFIFLERKNN